MKTTVALILFALFCAPNAQADTFGSGANQFDVEFVDIGNPGNLPDTTGRPNPAGTVLRPYRMGKFEISRDMITEANNGGGLGITMDSMGLVTGSARDDMPATAVSWFEAATFVNWLNTSTGGTPAYKVDNGGNFQLWQPTDAGFDPTNLYRNSQAKYFLPSVDEWYKAAYYDPNANGGLGGYWNYPTGSDTAPTAVASGTAADSAVYDQSRDQGPADITLAGGLSPYGTMGQGGNVWELEETDSDLVNDSSSSARGFRGGGWYNESSFLLSSDRNGLNPANEVRLIGFRVARIPEPSSLMLGALASVGLLMRRRH